MNNKDQYIEKLVKQYNSLSICKEKRLLELKIAKCLSEWNNCSISEAIKRLRKETE